MKTQELFNITAPSNKMDDDTFTRLISWSKLSIDSDTSFSFRGKYNNYEVDFAYDSDGNLDIECFGFSNRNRNRNRNGWVELKPTQKQISIMKSILDNVNIQREDKPIKYTYFDLYYEYGVSRANFY